MTRDRVLLLNVLVVAACALVYELLCGTLASYVLGDAVLQFSLVGLVLFGLAFLLMAKLAPFSLRKEIEEDQNTALGIIMGAVILGVALIVSAAVHG